MTTPPTWLTLLRNYRKRPTLPFIIGALRHYAHALDVEGNGFDQTGSLFDEMVTYPLAEAEKLIYVEICSELRVPVFSIVPRATTLYSRAHYPSRTPKETRLCFSTELEKSGSVNLNEIVDRVYHSFEHPEAIELQRYSRDKEQKIWVALTDGDRSDIERALFAKA